FSRSAKLKQVWLCTRLIEKFRGNLSSFAWASGLFLPAGLTPFGFAEPFLFRVYKQEKISGHDF
ncbi:MAG: hypothetical protein AAGU19_14485, partial [Prolixibacteraceae bacterium]